MEHVRRKLKSKTCKTGNTPEKDSQNVSAEEPQPETPPAQDNTESTTVQQETEPSRPSKKGEKYSFFLFVNPKSGGNKAAKLTVLELQKMLFYPSGPDDADIELFIYDMTNSENRQLGLSVLKKKQEKGKKNLHAIVGGGDGTVLWVIDEMVNAKIDFATCPIGVIPFGTGNDFSRVLGWGGTEPPHLIGNRVEGLKRQAEMWMSAKIEDFDIWDVKIETYDYGGLTHISKKKGPKFEKKYLTVVNPETKEETRAYSFTRKMSNYFSFGVDSRIGYDFDKRRTHSQLQNKFVYAWEGAKQLFLRNPKVDDVLDEMSHYIPGKDGKDDDKEEKEEKEEPDQGKLEKENEKEMKEQVREEPVREASPVTEEVHTEHPHESVQKKVQEEIHKEAREKPEPTKEEDAQKQEEIVLVEQHPDSETSVGTQDSEGMIEEGFRLLTKSSFKLKEKTEDSTAKVSVMQGNHGVFLCLNIPSYMGGASDPWATSKGRVGITSETKDPLKDFEDQNFGDGKLELLGFKGAASLALERCVHGRGWRLGQVRGPFILNYKVSKDKNKPLHSYMQIDGEFYDVIAPKSVQVSLSKDIPNGKIKVLWTPQQGKNIITNNV